MNKMSGNISAFSYLKEDGSRIIIGYGLQETQESGIYEWFEVSWYKKQKSSISFKEVKEAILEDINAQTDEKILSGFVWTPVGGEPVNVWLSNENQFNFSEADRKAETRTDILPITFKIGQDDNETPVYHTFTTYEELDGFYTLAFGYINQCLNEGWRRKDSIDWEPYKALFPNQDEPIKL